VGKAFPRILGHEAYGYVHVFLSVSLNAITQLLHVFHADDDECMCRVVESVGEHVEEFVPGDTVVPTFLGQCDACPSCASEHNNMCTAVPFIVGPGMRRDGTTRFRDAQGEPVHDLMAVSSFSEYTIVDMNQVVKLDPAVPPMLGCLLGCGAGTGEPSHRIPS
jgi:Zn-dependent alcohol dehydrogenase